MERRIADEFRYGTWCEAHPGREWPHDDCAGPGVPAPPPDGIGAVLNRDKSADVYIGRPGPWGNPFVFGPQGDTRDECLRRYAEYLWDRLEREPEFCERVAALAGKSLSCFCAPERCHGDLLARAAAQLGAV